jgi:hypothetical protein
VSRPLIESPARRVFAYWAGDDQSKIESFKAHWREAFPDFAVFSDAEVLPLLEKHFPQHVDLFRSIRIPTPKSDIARYLVLYEFGGFYVDCHMGIRDAAGIRRLLATLDEKEAVFFRLAARYHPASSEITRPLIAGAIVGRPRLPLYLDMVERALSNLANHRRREAKHGYTPYRIYHLVGPGLLTSLIFQTVAGKFVPRPGFLGRALFIDEEDAPVLRNEFKYDYQYKPGSSAHWSEREKSELLFMDRTS